jgi:hypothetical protein
MRYPNACKGVKKVFVAEILTLLVAVFGLVGAVTAAVGLYGQDTLPESEVEGTVLSGGALILAAGIMGLVSMIINLVGLHQGGKDEPGMRYAFIVTLLALVSKGAGAAINANSTSTIGNLLDDLGGLFNFLAIVFVIASIIRLAELLGDQKMVNKGGRLNTIILFCLLASFLLEITPRIFSGSIAENMVEVLGVAAAVCAVLGYVLYLSFLSKANKMLAK